jgi:D-arabinose 1-dehydrogenase-like Zn-dependent alcohol dehydrogenase
VRSYQITCFGEPLEARDYAEPQPSGSQVVVRVEACGVCHSDLHIWSGSFDLGGGKRISTAERVAQMPFTMGHEIVGTVAAVGPEAEGVKVGDRGIVFPWIGCGACFACRKGEELRCIAPRTLGTRRDGGYSDRVVVPHGRYVVPYDGLDPALAATCACSGLTAWSALHKLPKLDADDALLVIGAGGVGLAGLAASLLPCPVVVADIGAEKRAAATAAGANGTVDPASADARNDLLALTGRPPLAVIDFVGSPASLRFAMEQVATGGTIVVVGLFGGETPLSIPLLPLRQITLRGSYVGTLAELKALVAHMQAQRVRTVPIATRPMAEVNAILHDLEAGRIVGRCVMTT